MRRPSLRVLLAASLLVNLFAAGAVVGTVLGLRGRMVLPAHQAPVNRPLRLAGADLPRADRLRFQAAMREALRDTKPLAQAARDARIEAASLFDSAQFDPALVAAALDRARAADFAQRARLEAAAIDFAATLPQDERILLADGLARGGPLRHPRNAPPPR